MLYLLLFMFAMAIGISLILRAVHGCKWFGVMAMLCVVVYLTSCVLILFAIGAAVEDTIPNLIPKQSVLIMI